MQIKRPTPSTLHEMLSLNDIQKLILILYKDNINQIKSSALLFELLTGARIGEIKNLRKKEFNINYEYINITEQYTVIDENGTFGSTELKTKYSPRKIYIPKLLRDKIENIIKKAKFQNSYIFSIKKNTPVTTPALNNYLSKICDEIKIIKLTTHKLRALYATLALYSGANIITVSRQLGHASTKETQRYLRFVEELDKESSKKIDNIIENLRKNEKNKSIRS